MPHKATCSYFEGAGECNCKSVLIRGYDTLTVCRALRGYGWRVYMTVVEGNKELECISQPFPNMDGSFGIMLREKGDSTTMVEFRFPDWYVQLAIAYAKKHDKL